MMFKRLKNFRDNHPFPFIFLTATILYLSLIGGIFAAMSHLDNHFNSFCESKGFTEHSSFNQAAGLVSCCDYDYTILDGAIVKDRDCELLEYGDE